MKKITFRTQTKGEIDDLLEDEGLQCALSQALIAAFVGQLLHYTEEGKPLTPSIMYCQEIGEVIAGFPGAVRYDIGEITLSADAAKAILKVCAPLAVGSWHIFVERTEPDRLSYGVFKYPMLPTTVPLHESLEITQGNHFAIIIRRTSPSSVEVRGSKGRHTSFLFSTVRDDTVEANSLDKITAACCRGLGRESEHEAFTKCMKGILERTLTACHGTILLCGAEAALAAEPALKDATWLLPPLDIWAAFKKYRSSGEAEALLALHHLEELLGGLMNSDGIVAFNDIGRVLAYRMFYSSAAAAAAPGAGAGGARRRAFEGVKTLIGTSVGCALFRSQDGNMIFAGDGNE